MDKNIFERRADELQRYKRTDETIFPERKAMSSRYKAPYIPPAWLEKFLDLNRRQRIDKVEPEFVRLNIMGSGNESKILSAFRFLGLIDENCYATQRLVSLRVLGDEFKKNLKSVVTEAYHDLISTVVLDVAKPENLINFFVQRYDYSPEMAKNALRFFLWLALQSEIPVSDELKNFGIRTPAHVEPKIVSVSLPKPKSKKSSRAILEPETKVQATVNIHLDKDTPLELWDRVLALLGEKRRSEPEE